MKILILGAKGNLGQQLIKTFSGYSVLAWDREEINVLETMSLFAKLSEEKPHVIINTVAYNAVDRCEDDPGEYELALRLNRDVPAALAQWCFGNEATLVHYSTDYVFAGNEGKQKFAEDDEVNPINKYGLSKSLGEKELIAYQEKGLKYYLIRTSKLFGPQGLSEFSKSSFFDVMLSASKTKSELEVVDEEKSCFTYTPDLAEATKALLFDNKEYGIYHLVNNEAATWYEAALALFELKGLNIKVNPVTGAKFPRPAKRAKYSILKNTKFLQFRSYKEALEEYLESIK
ncbi:MAG: NAD(P)-dependent oxidoreductase [Planctomycetes bacterium]|jgi:dTDP-4-dehydrorhamnose reductase|nr:NAD(P)-dependent oxidoreductase [Planctomycetota bacterium]